MTTFPMALAADVKRNRGLVAEALGTLVLQQTACLARGDVGKAQALAAHAFTLFPAVLVADTLLGEALKVDLADDPLAAAKLLGPMVMASLNTAALTAEGRKNAIGDAAHYYLVEALAEATRNMLYLREQFDQRTASGEPVERVLGDLFLDDPASPQAAA